MKEQLIATSKFLSLVLRHRPDVIGIDTGRRGLGAGRRPAGGLCPARPSDLPGAAGRRGPNERQAAVRVLRGRQPDSGQPGPFAPVDLGLVPVEPPELLYHGTVPRFLDSIRRDGLTKGKRHHVHLSPDIQTATKVGQRRGRPIVLVIEAGRMFRDGHKFFRSENGVWLTDAVPPAYLRDQDTAR